MMPVGKVFDSFVEAMAEKQHDLGTDSLKMMLTNSAPDAATDTQKSDITEIAAGNGYTAGGAALNVTSATQSGGLYKLIADDLQWTASAGSIGPFRYVVLYNSANDLLIAYWDYGSSVSVNSGSTFTVNLDQTGGTLTVQKVA